MNGIVLLVLILNMKSLVNSFFKSMVLSMLLLVAQLIVISPGIFSQEDCYSKLKKAQERFDAGLIEEIPSMLDSCLKEGFTKDQTLQAYRLLIQVYLFDYNKEKAEKTMLDLLSRFPEYKINNSDPVEFVNLYNQFQTKPQISFGLTTGINLSNIAVIEQFSTGSLNNLDADYKPGTVWPAIKLSFERYVATRAWLTLGLGYSFAGYEVNESMNFGREKLSFSEKMQFVDVPLYINYAFANSKKLTPYIFAGGQFSYLLRAEGELSRLNVADGAPSALPDITRDITDLRSRENIAVIGGIGFRYKIAVGYLRANIYYSRGITDYVKESSRYSDKEILYKYNYIDDRIKLDFINFNFGYSYIFYKTSKRTVTDTNSL